MTDKPEKTEKPKPMFRATVVFPVDKWDEVAELCEIVEYDIERPGEKPKRVRAAREVFDVDDEASEQVSHRGGRDTPDGRKHHSAAPRNNHGQIVAGHVMDILNALGGDEWRNPDDIGSFLADIPVPTGSSPYNPSSANVSCGELFFYGYLERTKRKLPEYPRSRYFYRLRPGAYERYRALTASLRNPEQLSLPEMQTHAPLKEAAH